MLFYMQRTDGKTHNFFGYNPNLKLNGASDGAFKVFLNIKAIAYSYD